MQKHHALFAMTALAVVAFAVRAQDAARDALTEPQVRALLTDNGYRRIDDLDFEDGMWETEATSADGNRVYLRVPANGSGIRAEALVSTLSKADVKAKLTAAGYSKVHDVEFDDGVWEAQAEREDGNDVILRVDPNSGEVLAVEND
ncbi:PepSY domain-containing protein [Pseudoxanthomonas sangjuensis]|uniref:PepSY domain-containing protein n=1 Tax=Pseudoxanthomonas sangjuensis TaxID=1503750 RepID=UPI001391A69E|nr:PepSY domain-containing protein [Pseudoxanthomonas sangjuensis]KAF1714539.1 peptidase M4 [Pseudoxanthomonas sangjuensis]